MLECASELEMPISSLVCWCARCAFNSGMLIGTEGVGNPTAEQKHHQHHHINTTTVASESDIFKIKVLAQVEERIWSDADLPVTRRDARPVERFCFQLDSHKWKRALDRQTLFCGLCFARSFLKHRAHLEVRKSIGDATPVLGLLVRSVRLVPLWHV